MVRAMNARGSIVFVCAVVATFVPVASAQQVGEARRATVVCHVGTATITAGELEDRMHQVPPYQLATFGDTPQKRTRQFLDQVMVPDLLLSLGAQSKHLDTELGTSYSLDHSRSDAAIRSIHKNLPAAAQISADEVKKYYDANKARYDAPERYNLWRILVKDRAEADQVIALAKKDLTLTNWNSLARDHSIDKANSMRGGNLGFLTLDGSSSEVGTTIESNVVAEATKVKDGELVQSPVPEGVNFAIIWRRGTVGASHRTLQDVEAQIKDTLWKTHGDSEVKRVTDELRASQVNDFNPALLDTIDITMGEGQIVPRKRPGQVAPAPKASGN